MRAIFLLTTITLVLNAQSPEIERLVDNELKMTFPSLYFKNNSTEYAEMPYRADSCFRYMASHIKDIKIFAVWRDSSEAEQLTAKRIEILKAGLHKFDPVAKAIIRSMGKAQKISQRTIRKGADAGQVQYLLSLNSVIDITKTRELAEKKAGKQSHIDHPRAWCLRCWKNGRFSKEYRRLHVKKSP